MKPPAPAMREVAEIFGAIVYPVPRIGEHGSWSCTFGNHWWAIVRSQTTNAVLAVACGACRKALSPVHDLANLEPPESSD